MPNIPTDPMILLSYINTKLRDDYESLQELCDSLGISIADINEKLSSIGYSYDAALNRFV